MATTYSESTEVGGRALIEGGPVASRRVSWGAIFAGSVVAVAISTMLHLLGAGIGAASIDATGGTTPSASAFTTGAAIWLAVSTLVGLGAGGFVAGRLSGTTDTEDGLLHGLAVWAVAALLTMAVAGSATVSVAGAMANGLGSVLGGAASGAGAAAAGAARNTDQREAVDRLTRTLAAGGDPAAMTDDQRTNAVTVLIQRRVQNGSWTAEDRARAVALVQHGANVPEEEANRRVTAIEQNMARAEAQAREAADAAARAASRAAFWGFAALLIGAIVGAAGAAAGVRNAAWLLTVRRRAVLD
jgi:hypothetical protein